MDKITLHSAGAAQITAVSNIFIDEYMPSANGSYVKVYLYLLRSLSGHGGDFSISYLADQLENTEKDIVRALKYWEKVGLLDLSAVEDTITSITMKEPLAPEAASSASGMVKPTDTASQDSQNAAPDRNLPPHPAYTDEQIQKLKSNEEVKWTLNIIEIYMERPLKPKDIQLILYLYDTIGFSSELIMYLYEYCISKGKKNASYIEAVALAWAEQEISTVEQAESASTAYNSSYTAVNRAFGLNRAPGKIEKDYMDKWFHGFGFSVDIVVEACNRTLLNTQKADFKYTDRILDNWYKNNIKTMDDIRKADKSFNAAKAAKAPAPRENTPVPKANNRFNAFPQRSYSRDDYAAIEERLLNKQS